jgi:hypothetical protein
MNAEDVFLPDPATELGLADGTEAAEPAAGETAGSSLLAMF